MSEIPNITIPSGGVKSIGGVKTIDSNGIRYVQIPDANLNRLSSVKVWQIRPTVVPNIHPPVTVQIGNPIVEMPGCVEMHKDNNDPTTKVPFDTDLVNQDPRGTIVLCPQGEYPSFAAIDYTPEQLVIKKKATEPPPIAPSKDKDKNKDDLDAPETPPIPKTNTEIDCPSPGQPRVGDLTASGDEKVIGHKLSDNGRICIVLYEPTTVIDKYLPQANVVTTTATIATVATASALFAKPIADLLLKGVKPIVKKVIAKVQKILGKTPQHRPSRQEILTDRYRKSKELPPLKKPKKPKKG